MSKKEIRTHVLQAMKALDREKKGRDDKYLLEKLCNTPEYVHARVIATYMALPHEYNTQDFIERALKDGKQVLIPRTLAHRGMEFCDITSSDLARSSFGILEPLAHTADSIVSIDSIDMIHVPLVAVNHNGFRIGYGGGYYDRFLSGFAGSTISTTYGCQVCDFTPDSFDIAVQTVLVAR